MAEFSYPFDAGSGAIVTEDDWSDMAKNWQDDGVVSDSLSPLALEVEALGELNTVYVNPGMAVIQGFMYRNTDVLPLSFSTNGSGNPRRDRVVLRLDRTTNVIQAVVKEGTPAASPVAPDVNTVYPIYEISLGWYQVAASSSITLTALQEKPYTSRRIRVSDDLGTQPKGSIVYSPTDDTFHMIKSGSSVEIGSGGGGSQKSWTLRKTADQLITGTTSRVDDDSIIFTPTTGLNYVIDGTIYYWCNTPAASMAFALGLTQSTPPSVKVSYIYQTSASVNPATATFASSTTGVTVGSVASSTFYAVRFEFSGRVFYEDEEFDLIAPYYTPANGAHQWTISANSWMRVTQTE
jgi:hypothetical protein